VEVVDFCAVDLAAEPGALLACLDGDGQTVAGRGLSASCMNTVNSVLDRAFLIRSSIRSSANPQTPARCQQSAPLYKVASVAGCEQSVTKPARLTAASVGIKSRVSSLGPQSGAYADRDARVPSSHWAVSSPRSRKVRASCHIFLSVCFIGLPSCSLVIVTSGPLPVRWTRTASPA
jgi:hypothetical protein